MLCNKCGTLKESKYFSIKRRTCKKCVNESRYLKRKYEWNEKEWAKHKYFKLKSRAKSRRIEFTISFEEIYQLYKIEECYFCLEKVTKKSIDRLDNVKGYLVGNCVMSCILCNRLKGDLTKTNKDRLLKILTKLV